MLKLSKYSELINNENEVIIFNTYNGNRSRLFDKKFIEVAYRLKNGEILSEDDIDSNFAKLYCVDSNLNEADKIIEEYYRVVKDTTTLSIIVYPTMECNFRCLYCYENHTFFKMTRNTINGIKNFIKELNEKNKFKVFQISWFGGEPTLCFDIIEEINLFVLDIAKKNNAKFSSAIVTNAYTLNTELFLKLIKLGINFFQITVDGFEHDKYRFLKDGSPTLKTIMTNLINISSLDKSILFNILIRNNIMANNKCFEWYDYLKNKFGTDKRFSFSVVPVAKLGGQNDDKLDVINDDTSLIEEHINYMIKIGLNYSQQIVPYVTNGVCYASLPHGYVLRENGNINKCTIALNSDLNIVGKIYEDSYRIFFEKEKLWIKDRFFNKCKNCKNGLVCLNKACPYRLINNGLREKCMYEICK